MDSCLKFGDLIILHFSSKQMMQGENLNGASTPSEGRKEGFLAAMGFMDNQIYLQEAEGFEQARSGMKASDPRVPNMVNYRDAVFVICPKLSSEFHKEHQKSREYYQKLKKADKMTEKQYQLKKNLEIKLEKLSERVMKEKELNEILIRESAGTPVVYGAEVCLMHYDSSSFIKANNDCAQTNKIGYDCQLSTWQAYSMVFKILPRYKNRQDGEIIQYNDNIIFQNLKFNTHLSFTTDLVLPHDNKFEADELNPFIYEQHILSPDFNRYKVYLSQEAETSWRVILFRKVGEAKHLVKGNELIRFKHTELNGFMAAQLCHRNGPPDVYVRNYVGEFKEEENSVSCIWEVEHPDLFERGREFAMEEFNTNDETNYLKSSYHFRLRHFQTGLLLHKKMTKSGREELHLTQGYSGLEGDAEANHEFLDLGYSTISCLPILKNITSLQSNSSYYLIMDWNKEARSSDMKYVKTMSSTKGRLTRDYLMKMFEMAKFPGKEYFSPLNESDLNTERRLMYCDNEFSTEDAFIIEKIEADYQVDILMVRSCLPFLKSLAYEIKSQKKGVLNSEVYFKVEEILNSLCGFFFEVKRPSEIQLRKLQGHPSPKRQQILKEMKVIDIIVDLLYYPFASGMFEITKIQSSEPIANMLFNLYTTLRFAIQEYRPSELHASQYLSLIMEQTLKTREYNDIHAGRTLTELIDNNQRILETRIKKETIESFVSNLLNEERDAKCVNILRAICICDGKPMIKNQKLISELFLKQPHIVKQLVFPLRKFGGKLEVQAIDVNEKWFEIREFKQNSETAEISKSFTYFVAMINLCADLCADRNYLAVEVLSVIYPIEFCIDIITDEKDAPAELRSAFCRLLQHLWMVIYPYQELSLPEYTKVLIDKEVDDNLIACTQEDTSKFQKVITFCLKHLNSVFSERIVSTNTEDIKAKNELSLNVLDLLE